MSPQTSIIITTHNRPHLLPRAVESARASGSRLEVIVVDDASTDETARVCRHLPGIVYVRVERNQRVAGARNLGILASRGPYLTFLDDDDVRLPGSLDLQVEVLESHTEAGLVYGQAIIGDQNCRSTKSFYPAVCPQGDVFWELLSRNFIPCGTALFRRSCLERVGLLDGNVPGLDDWDFWIRVAERYPVVALEQPLMIWRRSTPASRQGTSHASEMVKLCAGQFRERWLKLPRAAKAAAAGESRRAQRRFLNNMSKHLLWEAGRALGGGQLVQAYRNMSTVLRLYPLGVARSLMRPAPAQSLLARRVGESRRQLATGTGLSGNRSGRVK